MIKKAAFLLAVVVILGVILTGCGNKEAGVPATVASVDGKSISGSTYYEYLNMAWGRQILPMVIEQQVLLNWAEKEGVPVTDEQINKQIDVLKRDGVYDQQLTAAGNEQALKDQYRGLQARINLGRKMYKFADGELLTMYNNPGMRNRYVHGPRKNVEIIVSADPKKLKDAADAVKGGMDFDEAAMKYSDPAFVQNGPQKASVEKGQGVVELQNAASATKVGEVSKPFSFKTPRYGSLNAILKVLGEQPKENLPFTKVKDEVKDMAAIQRVMSDPDFQKKLAERKKTADITIDMPQYKYMIEQIKNPPPPQNPMGMQQPAPQQAPKK